MVSGVSVDLYMHVRIYRQFFPQQKCLCANKLNALFYRSTVVDLKR